MSDCTWCGGCGETEQGEECGSCDGTGRLPRQGRLTWVRWEWRRQWRRARVLARDGLSLRDAPPAAWECLLARTHAAAPWAQARAMGPE